VHFVSPYAFDSGSDNPEEDMCENFAYMCSQKEGTLQERVLKSEHLKRRFGVICKVVKAL